MHVQIHGHRGRVLLTTQHLLRGGGGGVYPPPPSPEVIGPNSSLGLPPIKNFLWHLRRKVTVGQKISLAPPTTQGPLGVGGLPPTAPPAPLGPPPTEARRPRSSAVMHVTPDLEVLGWNPGGVRQSRVRWSLVSARALYLYLYPPTEAKLCTGVHASAEAETY